MPKWLSISALVVERERKSECCEVNEDTLIQRMKESGLAMSQNGVDIPRTASAPGVIIQRSLSPRDPGLPARVLADLTAFQAGMGSYQGDVGLSR